MKRYPPDFFVPIHKRPSFNQFLPSFNLRTYCTFLNKPKIELVHPEEKIFKKYGLEAGHASIQGYRSTMEDQYIMEELEGSPGHFMFAILDGHAGSGTSRYVSQHLPSILVNEPDYKAYFNLFSQHYPKYLKEAKSSNPTESKIIIKEKVDKETEEKLTNLLTKAITKAFLTMDKKLKYLTLRGMIDISGSTCICSILTPTHIITANCGDSRSVIGGFSKIQDNSEDSCYVTPLSKDHKPKNKLELKRIEDAGGFVQENRVMGELSLSRAFGDFIYKDNRVLPVTEQMVIPVPDVSVWKRLLEENKESDDSPTDRYLLLACDGVWDVLRRDEAIEFIKMSEILNLQKKMKLDELEKKSDDDDDSDFNEGDETPELEIDETIDLSDTPLTTSPLSLAADLVYNTLSLNSSDNISVLIVKIF